MVHSRAADPGAELRTREHSTGGEPTSLWTHVCITVRFIWGRVADAQVVPVGSMDSQGGSCPAPVGGVH